MENPDLSNVAYCTRLALNVAYSAWSCDTILQKHSDLADDPNV
jgi:hypothetical protein